jgi:hypothetical protein
MDVFSPIFINPTVLYAYEKQWLTTMEKCFG